MRDEEDKNRRYNMSLEQKKMEQEGILERFKQRDAARKKLWKDKIQF